MIGNTLKFVSTLFILITLNSQASTSCEELETNFNRLRNRVAASCAGLKKCQVTRKVCDQELTSKDACEEFKSCMMDQYPQNNGSPITFCDYQWDRFDNKCKNTNQTWHAVARGCPGFLDSNTQGYDHHADHYLNCSGHKSRYLSFYIKHLESYQELKKAVETRRCRAVFPVTKLDFCPEANRSVEYP